MSVKILGYNENRKPVSVKYTTTNTGTGVDSEGKPILVAVGSDGYIDESLIKNTTADITADIAAMSIALG